MLELVRLSEKSSAYPRQLSGGRIVAGGAYAGVSAKTSKGLYTSVLNAADLIQRVASTPVGQQVTLVFLRDANGKLDKRTATVALGERPSMSPCDTW